jgi:outer membrane lipoprotein carrier protein
MRPFHPKFQGGRLLTAAFLLAAASFCAGQSAPSVHDLAQRVDQRYNHLHSLKAGFSESYAGMGRRRTESGTLLLVKPGRMRWDYSQPAGKLFLLDGKFAWFYTRGSAQAQRIPAKQLDDLRSPLRFLLGHTQLEKELVNLHMAAGPNATYTLTGQPKGQEQRVARMSLTVTADGTILAIEGEESDGSITRFSFTGEQENVALSPDLFRFALPTGVTIVDALPPL